MGAVVAGFFMMVGAVAAGIFQSCPGQFSLQAGGGEIRWILQLACEPSLNARLRKQEQSGFPKGRGDDRIDIHPGKPLWQRTRFVLGCWMQF